MRNNNSHTKNNFPIENIENPIKFSNNATGIIFPIGEKNSYRILIQTVFLWEIFSFPIEF